MSKVGHWPLHEWSGDAQDLSGNGNDGTVNGPTQGVLGKGGLTGYSFDGTDDYVDMGDSSAHKFGSGDFTISCWVRLNSTSSNQYFVDKRQPSSPYTGYQLHVDGDSQFSFSYDDGTDANGTNTGTTVPTYEWTHLCGVRNGDTFTLYVNGSQSNSITDSSIGDLDTSQQLAFGDRPGSSGFYLDGYLADVRLYDFALSSSLVSTLHEWRSGDYTDPTLHDGSLASAEARYEFTSGSVTADSWNNNTLTDNTSAGTTTDAIRGDAKSFDGTDDSMDGSSLSTPSNITAVAWVKAPASQSDNNSPVFTESDAFEMIFNDSIPAMRMFVTVGSTSYEAQADIIGNEWIMYAMTYDGETLKAYQNGVEMARNTSPSGSIDSGSGDFTIGAYPGGSAYLEGDIDDVRIYDRELSAAEVAQLYRWGGGGRDLRQRTVIA